MPWGGKSTHHASRPPTDVQGAIKLRVPGWARNRPAPGALYRVRRQRATSPSPFASTTVRCSPTPDPLGYVSLDRLWKNGDVVEVEFPMDVRRVVADDRVKDRPRPRGDRARTNRLLRRVARMRGRQRARPAGRRVSAASTLGDDPAQLGGVTVIRTQARAASRTRRRPATPLTLIPYYLWANRGAGEMSVWLVDAGVRAWRRRSGRRPDLLRESELRGRRLALSRGGAVRSKRGRQVGLLPQAIRRRARHGRRHGQAEHARHALPLQRARHRGRALRESTA